MSVCMFFYLPFKKKYHSYMKQRKKTHLFYFSMKKVPKFRFIHFFYNFYNFSKTCPDQFLPHLADRPDVCILIKTPPYYLFLLHIPVLVIQIHRRHPSTVGSDYSLEYDPLHLLNPYDLQY